MLKMLPSCEEKRFTDLLGLAAVPVQHDEYFLVTDSSISATLPLLLIMCPVISSLSTSLFIADLLGAFSLGYSVM
jgi:hypothetical protein